MLVVRREQDLQCHTVGLHLYRGPISLGEKAFRIRLLLNWFDTWSESQKKGLLFPWLPPSYFKLSDYDCFWEWRINSSGILQTIIRQVSSSDCKHYSISAPWQICARAWCPPPLSKVVWLHSDVVVLAPTLCPATPTSLSIPGWKEGPGSTCRADVVRPMHRCFHLGVQKV